jgi:hypothetical protein
MQLEEDCAEHDTTEAQHKMRRSPFTIADFQGSREYRHISDRSQKKCQELMIASQLHVQWLLGDSCAKGAPKLQRGQGIDDLGMHTVGLPQVMYDASLLPLLQKCTILRQTVGTVRLHSITAKTMLSTIFTPNFLTRSWPADDLPSRPLSSARMLTPCRSDTTRRMKRSKQLFRLRR